MEQNLNGFEYRVDESYDYYLDNWYTQMDLVCANMVGINFMLSARYIVYGIAGFLLFSLPDKYGRKWTLVICAAVMIVAQLLMIFVPTFEARMISFIMFGLAMLKMSLPYIYMAELVPPSYTASTSVSMTSFDSSPMFVYSLYLLFISRNWMPIILATTILAAISLIFAAICMPESPSWLLSQGRVEEAIDSFNVIAKFNGVSARIPHGTTFHEAGGVQTTIVTSPANISQLVANNLSMHKTADVTSAPRVKWSIVIMLTLMAIGAQNAYWLTLLNVTNLKGNTFINGLILGSAELLSGIFTGIMIKFTSATTAF